MRLSSGASLAIDRRLRSNGAAASSRVDVRELPTGRCQNEPRLLMARRFGSGTSSSRLRLARKARRRFAAPSDKFFRRLTRRASRYRRCW